jgi:hypothetical protein
MHSSTWLSIGEISRRLNQRATTNNYEQQGVLDTTQWTQEKLWQRDRNVRKVRSDSQSGSSEPRLHSRSWT